ncbi:triphosphoribosyl-dephospho-CoA synthase CitG [Pantoea sp. BAV 3049]|uniref:triphosphoribosyl-dephospho-CoA synthase CitG n=1 Tax=Pantoea sp. BAV 3049 TaxID=2654188 RepID=UPI00131E09E8|nr:triphosphoribosyl-dephospho-CoA synthase CitG [Pantoea sp. BAV 3049]
MQLLSRNKPGVVDVSPDPNRFAADAIQALLAEVNLTPKPGLVDRRNNGAHTDMHIGTFCRSVAAINLWLPRFIHQGRVDAVLPENRVLSRLRPAGMACESHMYRATGGVNTHKGSIFSLALLCAVFGRLYQQRKILSAATLCHGVAAISQGLVSRELENNNPCQTAGQRLYATYGLKGARGEAEAGFPLVINGALPLLHQGREQGHSEQEVMTDCLLWLMAHNDDTNVVSRGGMAGLRWLKQESAALLAQRERGNRQAGWEALIRFDDACIARNLSPGGSADLLIVSWLLARLPQS